MWSVKWMPNPGLARISASRGVVDGGGRVGVGADLHGRWSTSIGERRYAELSVNRGPRCASPATRARSRRRPRTSPRRARLGSRSATTASSTRAAASSSPRWSSSSAVGQDRRRRVGLLLAGDVGRRAVHRLEHARRGAVGVDVAAGRQADAAGDGGGEVGDDVAEQVVGDDHVEARRVGGHEDRGGVDVQVVDRDVGELRRDLLRRAATTPRRRCTSTLVLWTRVSLRAALLGPAERVADDALHPEGRVDADLGGDLVRRTDPERAAVAGVGALGALADDDEVDLTRVGQRRGAPGKIRDGRRLT